MLFCRNYGELIGVKTNGYRFAIAGWRVATAGGIDTGKSQGVRASFKLILKICQRCGLNLVAFLYSVAK
jgi:hypothetical protein